MQKTTAKKRYPVLEKLLELDLDLTSLKDSRRSSPEFTLKLSGLLIDVLDKLSPSSRIFLALFDGIIPRESSSGLESIRSFSTFS